MKDCLRLNVKMFSINYALSDFGLIYLSKPTKGGVEQKSLENGTTKKPGEEFIFLRSVNLWSLHCTLPLARKYSFSLQAHTAKLFTVKKGANLQPWRALWGRSARTCKGEGLPYSCQKGKCILFPFMESQTCKLTLMHRCLMECESVLICEKVSFKDISNIGLGS